MSKKPKKTAAAEAPPEAVQPALSEPATTIAEPAPEAPTDAQEPAQAAAAPEDAAPPVEPEAPAQAAEVVVPEPAPVGAKPAKKAAKPKPDKPTAKKSAPTANPGIPANATVIAAGAGHKGNGVTTPAGAAPARPVAPTPDAGGTYIRFPDHIGDPAQAADLARVLSRHFDTAAEVVSEGRVVHRFDAAYWQGNDCAWASLKNAKQPSPWHPGREPLVVSVYTPSAEPTEDVPEPRKTPRRPAPQPTPKADAKPTKTAPRAPQPERKTAPTTPAVASTGKQRSAQVIALLQRSEGATYRELVQTTGWGFGGAYLAGIAKKAQQTLKEVGTKTWRLV